MQLENDVHLIDLLLPEPHYKEQHHLDLLCDQQAAYESARTLDFNKSRIARSLFRIRGLHLKELTLEAMTTNDTFRILGERPPTEFVIGHVSEGTKPVVISTADDFRALEVNNGIKIAWNFRTESLGGGVTRLHTETRVSCHGKTAARLFRPYWFIVKPFSGLIRKEMLKAAAATNQIDISPTSRKFGGRFGGWQNDGRE